MIRPSLFLLASVLLLAGGAVRADEDVRFSKSLGESEVEAAGLSRLSSDQVAVLDALVRRDVAQSQFVTKEPRADRFTERLTADERRNAGLQLLKPDELSQLDAAVARLTAPPDATLTQGGGPPSQPIHSVKLRRDPEIHGSLTLMVAAGSHGYRAYGGGVELYYDDPANRFSVGVGLSEVRSKGGIYRGGYYDDYRYGWPRSPFDRRW